MPKPKANNEPTVHVTSNGRRFVKASELLSSHKVQKIMNSMAEIPIRTEVTTPQESTNKRTSGSDGK